MAFLNEIKNEICATPPKNSCCRRSLAFGMMAVRGRCEGDAQGVSLRLSDPSAATLAEKLISEQFGRQAVVGSGSHGGKTKTLRFESSAARRFVEEMDKGSATGLFQRQCPHCATYFLRGMFLGAGRITDPSKAYHLELSLENRARLLAGFLLEEYGTAFKYTERRAEKLLYLKDSSLVEEFMTMLGINEAAFRFMNSKIEKQFRNEANRRTNCEAGNIARSVSAAQKVVRVIERLEADKLLSSLPEELERVARARMENPEASLTQLASMLTPSITKSGLNHRLQRIMEYAAAMGIRLEED
ncbi:MAG: DNA-binding protein WhiA [Clostridia bacterium]|nr:DNA-binding protein WhiA [Clostridia bacterium]